MNKLSKEKKQKLFLAFLGIAGGVGLLYTYVLSNQFDYVDAYQRRVDRLTDTYLKNQRLVDRRGRILEQLEKVRGTLDAKEADMVPPGGKSYIFFFKLVDEFRRKQGLEPQFIADMTQAEVGPVELLPRFPYQAATFGVKLSGQFHEIGKFISDFENAYPYMRIQNIRLQPELTPRQQGPNQFAAPPPQKLVAHIQVVALLRPGTS